MYFFASTDAGPVKNWFSLANEDSRVTNSIYVAVLRKDDPSPLLKESDEEKGAPAKDEKKEDKKDDVAPTAIDFDGLSYRIVDLPIPAGDYQALAPGAEGQIYFLKTADGKSSLQRFDLKSRKTEPVVADADEYHVSFDGRKILVRAKSEWTIVAAKKELMIDGMITPIVRLRALASAPATRLRRYDSRSIAASIRLRTSGETMSGL